MENQITGEPPAKKVTLDVKVIVEQQVHTFEKPPKSWLARFIETNEKTLIPR